jgi:hypothetical protein
MKDSILSLFGRSQEGLGKEFISRDAYFDIAYAVRRVEAQLEANGLKADTWRSILVDELDGVVKAVVCEVGADRLVFTVIPVLPNVEVRGDLELEYYLENFPYLIDAIKSSLDASGDSLEGVEVTGLDLRGYDGHYNLLVVYYLKGGLSKESEEPPF